MDDQTQDQPQPKGQQYEQQLRFAGAADDQVDSWKAKTWQQLQDGGASQDQIRGYFGIKEPDFAAVKAHLQKQFQETPPPPSAGKGPTQAKDVWDAMKAGWQGSDTGLFFGSKMPDTEVGEDAPWQQKLVSSAAQMAGDLPAMLAGGAAASELGPIGMAAGAFAAPAAMRKMLTDQYQKGDIKDASDFAQRVVGATWEGAKGAAVGAATAAVGGNIAAVEALGGLESPLAKALTGTGGKLAGELAAQATVSSALEGKLPNKSDFINGAVAIGGLHAVGFGLGKTGGYVSDKLMNIYAKTGATPNEVVEAANKDPSTLGKLASDNPSVPPEATPTNPPPDQKPSPLTLVPKEAAAEPPVEPPKAGDGGEPPEEDPVKAAGDRISDRIGEKQEPEKLSFKDNLEDKINKTFAQRLDYTDVMSEAEKEMADAPKDEQSPHVLMRIHNAVMDKVREFVEVGTRDWDSREINGEGLQPIVEDLKKMGGQQAVDDFNRFRIAKRSLSLADRDIEQPGSREDDQTFVDGHPEMDDFMKRYVGWRNRTLDYLGGSGRYSLKSIEAMKEMGGDSFAPLKKILEPDKDGNYPTSARDIKRIGSSDLDLVDPWESDIRDTTNMIKLAHETEAHNAYVAKMEPEISEEQKGPLKENEVAGYEDGKRTKYTATPEEAEALKRMAGNQPAITTWTGLLKPFAVALRLGTVDNPLFAIRHAWRQQLTAATLSQTGLKLFQAIAYAPEFFARGESYHNFVFDGGAVNSIVPSAVDYVNGKIYDLNNKAPFIQKAWNLATKPLDFSHWAIVQNDNLLRFAEYKRMLGKGATGTEAAFAAREVLPDFQKQGLQRSAFSSITAFLDVHLQGQARMFQAGAKDFKNMQGLMSGSMEPMDALKQLGQGYIAKNLAYITVPSLLLAAAQHDDDAVKDLPDWQRMNYWTIHVSNWRPANSLAEAMSVQSAYPSNARQLPNGDWQVNDGHMVRVQKPFTNGILFGSGIEAAMSAWDKKDPGAMTDYAKAVAGSLVPEVIPTAAEPVTEHMVNRNFYTGQSLVRQSMENKLPEMQYDQYTSETAKALGKLVSYIPGARDIGPGDAKLSSPKVIDNYIHGWGGTLGSYAVDIADKGLRAAGIAPPDVKPVATLSDTPFVREFMIRFPNAHPQSVSDFEDRYKMADRVTNSIKQLVQQGDFEGASRLQDRYSMNMDRLKGVDSAIQHFNATIQKVNITPDIDPVQKRQLIDTLMYQMTNAAKQGNKLMDQFENNAQNKHGS